MAERGGHSREQLMASCDLSYSLLETETAPIPLTSFIALANSVMIAMDDESCGMLPKPVKPGTFALLCQSCIDCQTLGHFLRRRIKVLSLVSDGLKLNLHRQDETVYYEIESTDSGNPLSQHIVIVILAIAYKMGSWSIRERIPLTSVSVCGARSSQARGYDNLFDLPIDYGSNRNQLCFPAHYFDRPILQDADSMKELLKAPALYLMSEFGVQKSLAYEIRKYIECCSPENFPDLDSLATEFSLSVATLRRRLQNEDTTYQEIKNEVRRDRAVTVLVREGSVKAAAYAAGFTEPTSFFRAFKRWTGTTPKAYIS
nr:AraC family transcriptional regulator [Parahaliea mediterranea]